MKHRITLDSPNRTVQQLASFIRTVNNGDTIICLNRMQVELGKRAAHMLSKELTFVIASGQEK